MRFAFHLGFILFFALGLIGLSCRALATTTSTSTTTTLKVHPILEINQRRQELHQKAQAKKERVAARQAELHEVQQRFQKMRTDLSDQFRRDMKKIETEEQQARQEIIKKYE